MTIRSAACRHLKIVVWLATIAQAAARQHFSSSQIAFCGLRATATGRKANFSPTANYSLSVKNNCYLPHAGSPSNCKIVLCRLRTTTNYAVRHLTRRLSLCCFFWEHTTTYAIRHPTPRLLPWFLTVSDYLSGTALLPSLILQTHRLQVTQDNIKQL